MYMHGYLLSCICRAQELADVILHSCFHPCPRSDTGRLSCSVYTILLLVSCMHEHMCALLHRWWVRCGHTSWQLRGLVVHQPLQFCCAWLTEQEPPCAIHPRLHPVHCIPTKAFQLGHMKQTLSAQALNDSVQMRSSLMCMVHESSVVWPVRCVANSRRTLV